MKDVVYYETEQSNNYCRGLLTTIN